MNDQPHPEFKLLDPQKDCPLLKDVPALVERYRDLAGVFNQIRKEMPRLWPRLGEMSIEAARRKWEAIGDPKRQDRVRQQADIFWRMEHVQELLELPRYQVGFVGESQTGKSATINEALQMDLLPRGGLGRACTCTVTRVQFVPEGESAGVHLRYMSREEYRDRVRFFAGPKNLDLASEPDIDAKTEEELLQIVDAGSGGLGEGKRDLAERLRRLLHAGGADVLGEERGPIRFTGLAALIKALPVFLQEDLRSQGRSSEQSFEEDVLQACEPSDKPLLKEFDPSKKVLLREVLVSIPRESVSQTIELIDLPGLGTDNLDHDFLTLEYVRHVLQGLVVFQSADQLETAYVTTLIEKFRENVVDPRGRVWMIVTKIDERGKEPKAFYGEDDSEGDCWFRSLEDVLKRRPLGAEQVRFVCAPLSKKRRDSGNKDLPEQERLAFFDLRQGEDGHFEYPALLNTRFRHFRGHFDALLRDGGMSEFLRILETEIAERVRERVWDQVKEELVQIVEDLLGLLRDAERMAKMETSHRECAALWSDAATELALAVENGELFHGPAKELAECLWKVLNTHGSEDALALKALENGKLDKYHAVIADFLCENGLEKVRYEGGTIERCLELAAERFESLAAAKDRLKSDQVGTTLKPPDTDPVADLREGVRAECQKCDLITDDFQSLKDTVLFEGGRGQLDARGYRLLLERRVEALLYQVMQRISNRVRDVCDRLGGSLLVLALPKKEGEEYGDKARFEEFRGRLGQLQDTLRGLTYPTVR